MATENKAYIEGMRQIRHGNAAQPHRNHKKYTRKSKHKSLDFS